MEKRSLSRHKTIPAHNPSPELAQPGKGALNFPPPPVATCSPATFFHLAAFPFSDFYGEDGCGPRHLDSLKGGVSLGSVVLFERHQAASANG